MVTNLGSKKGNKNNESYPQLHRIHDLLIISTVNTPEKDLSHGGVKSVTSKVCKYLVKLSSKLFSCSVLAMYNRVHCT